jgi:hypothetical protein
MTCNKCHRTLQDCQACKGRPSGGPLGGKLTCRRCNNTGLECPKDGGHWR